MHKLAGYRKYPDGQIVRDEEVYRFIRKHSRLIDRLNPRKMVEMTDWAHLALDGSIAEEDLVGDWKYYGPKSKKT